MGFQLHGDRVTASFNSPYSAGLQGGDESVRRTELPRAKARRNDGLEDLQLLAGVPCDVDLAGLGSFMAKPEGHLPDVARGLQDVDAAGMAKDVR